jgi:hypothetical protein
MKNKTQLSASGTTETLYLKDNAMTQDIKESGLNEESSTSKIMNEKQKESPNEKFDLLAYKKKNGLLYGEKLKEHLAKCEANIKKKELLGEYSWAR